MVTSKYASIFLKVFLVSNFLFIDADCLFHDMSAATEAILNQKCLICSEYFINQLQSILNTQVHIRYCFKE